MASNITRVFFSKNGQSLTTAAIAADSRLLLPRQRPSLGECISHVSTVQNIQLVRSIETLKFDEAKNQSFDSAAMKRSKLTLSGTRDQKQYFRFHIS